MSLNYHFDKIKNYMDVVYINRDPSAMQPETNALIWYTLILGLGSITEKNVDEFYLRMKMWESVVGCALLDTKTGYGVPISYSTLRSHIGLHTNVSDSTKPQFHAKIILELRERAKTSLRAELTGSDVVAVDESATGSVQ